MGREYPQGPVPIHKHGLPDQSKLDASLTRPPPCLLFLVIPQRLRSRAKRSPRIATLNSHNDVSTCQSMQLALPDRVPNNEQIQTPPAGAFEKIQLPALLMLIQDHCHQCPPQP